MTKTHKTSSNRHKALKGTHKATQRMSEIQKKIENSYREKKKKMPGRQSKIRENKLYSKYIQKDCTK